MMGGVGKSRSPVLGKFGIKYFQTHFFGQYPPLKLLLMVQ